MKHHLIMSSAFCTKEDVHAREVIQAVNQRLSHVKVSESEKPGHAEAISRAALKSGAESILVAAGDATINEVVNGFFEDNEPVAGKPHLGIIPTGSPGDFKRTAGTPGRLTDAVSRICSNEPRSIDLGKITTADGRNRYFANVASTGVSASIGKSNRSRINWLRQIDGDLAFNWSVVKNSLLHKRFPLRITMVGGSTMEWDANCVAVCNGQSFGGGIKVAREADISDGFLDVIVVHDFTKVGFLKGVNQIREDETAEFDGISTIRATSVEIACDDPKRKIMIDADNSYAGILPAKFEVVPDAVNLF